MDIIKKPPPEKETKYMTQEITQKNKSKQGTPKSTVAKAEDQETERKIMKSSSTAANQWSVPAQPEHRRQDGWTSTLCGSDGTKQDSDLDTNAGERLQKQRPHPNRSGCSDGCVVLAGERLPNQHPLGEDHPEHNPEEQPVAQVPHQGEEAGSIVLHSSSNVSEFMYENKEAHVTAFAAAKVSEEFVDKDAEILRLIKQRRSTPKEEKQRIKDLSTRIKNASEKRKE